MGLTHVTHTHRAWGGQCMCRKQGVLMLCTHICRTLILTPSAQDLKGMSCCRNGNGSSAAAQHEHNTRQASGAEASFSGRPDQLTCRLIIDCMVSMASLAVGSLTWPRLSDAGLIIWLCMPLIQQGLGR